MRGEGSADLISEKVEEMPWTRYNLDFAIDDCRSSEPQHLSRILYMPLALVGNKLANPCVPFQEFRLADCLAASQGGDTGIVR